MLRRLSLLLLSLACLAALSGLSFAHVIHDVLHGFQGETFNGKSFLHPLSTQQVGIFNVKFEPGSYNEWHTHFASKGGGQILIAISGRGYYQEEGKTAQELKPGDVVNIPANVKHWHDAAKDSWFQHVALEVPGEDTRTEWYGFLPGEEYKKLK